MFPLYNLRGKFKNSLIFESSNYGSHGDITASISKDTICVSGGDHDTKYFQNYGVLVINVNGHITNSENINVTHNIGNIDISSWHNISGYIIPGTSLSGTENFYHFNDTNTIHVEK